MKECEMKIKVLGCSGAEAPEIDLRALLDNKILFDTGSLLILMISGQLKIEHIFITHSHLDHIIEFRFSQTISSSGKNGIR
jgi:ribonuclease BN (tRNA processing enzyme)